MTGQELIDYLNVAAKMTPGSGAFAQFAGVELDITSGAVSQVHLAGRALEIGKIYRLAINNFQAGGGDGYPKLTDHPSFVNTGFVDADVLRAFISKKSPLKAADFAPGSAVVRR